MATLIFKNYSDFLVRENKKVNGVSQDFADINANWEKDNENNEGCWNCSDCTDCSDCMRCSDCTDCSGCSDCSGCTGCSDCTGYKMKSEDCKYPIIENIHQKVFSSCSRIGSLDMNSWHTCDTTHCRAGWVVYLAGKEGEKLESKTSTLFAAMMIYKASSSIRVSPVRFFESNEIALSDMEKCAKEEANQK